MKLTVMNIAYPFAPVGPDAVGGAEQVLSQIDFALTRAGHTSIVVACAGSSTAGILLPTTRLRCCIDDHARRCLHEEYRDTIARALRRWPVDLIHIHSLDFSGYLPPPGVPILITLHSPLSWYNTDELFAPGRPDVFMHCVSPSQRRTFPDAAPLLPPIPNGVDGTFFQTRHATRRFAVTLGRICPEKGFHIAIDAAKRADIPLLIGGKAFNYEEHRRYFDTEIVPRLDATRRLIGPVGMPRKRRLLSAARCLLLPSTASETSSLVTMEALACGTPVIAFPSGALPDLVEHGKTGFLVRDEKEMADAIAASDEIDPQTCRESARSRFNLERTLGRYFEFYRKLALWKRLGSAARGVIA